MNQYNGGQKEMQTQEAQESYEKQGEIRNKIAELRQRFGRLKAICGLQGISRETMAEYAAEIDKLERKLN